MDRDGVAYQRETITIVIRAGDLEDTPALAAYNDAIIWKRVQLLRWFQASPHLSEKFRARALVPMYKKKVARPL